MLELTASAAADSTGFHAEKRAKVLSDRQERYGRKAYISFVIVCYPLSALQAVLAAYISGQTLRNSTTNVIRWDLWSFPRYPVSLHTPHF